MNKEELLKLDKEEIITLLFAIIEQQAKMIEQLKAEINDLKAQLNQNSKNSSKPPSSDGFKKQKSLRQASGKKPGGQKGHEGSGFKLPVTTDVYIKHKPVKCTQCLMAAECQSEQTVCETRYEVDINVQLHTSEHQSIKVRCPQTSELLKGDFPKNITGTMQYGTNLEALAVSLNTVGMVSINRTHEILSGVFDVPISTGAISSMISRCAGKVAETVLEIKEAIIAEPVVHYDETGTRVDTKTYWAHTASTDKMTYIDVQPKRGKDGMDAIGILPRFCGKAIHDCWASYFLYVSVLHGLCNAHLLRELIAVFENTGQTWAQALIELLLAMKRMKEQLISQELLAAPAALIAEYSQKYDTIVIEALGNNPVITPEPGKKGKPKRGKTGALVDRLILRKNQYLLFFADFSVPFDNNQAERDIRMFKVKQKVSGCFRTFWGARDFSAISSYVGTARKHGISGFIAIRSALLGTPFSLNGIL